MLEFLVCGSGGDKEALLVAMQVLATMLAKTTIFRASFNVPSRQSADNPGSGNSCMANGNDVLKFGFEDTFGPPSVLRILPFFARRSP